MDTQDSDPYALSTTSLESLLESPLESPPLRSPPLRYYAQHTDGQNQDTSNSEAVGELQSVNTMQQKQPITIMDKVKGMLHARKKSA